jgi:hypothetical protein
MSKVRMRTAEKRRPDRRRMKAYIASRIPELETDKPTGKTEKWF